MNNRLNNSHFIQRNKHKFKLSQVEAGFSKERLELLKQKFKLSFPSDFEALYVFLNQYALKPDFTEYKSKNPPYKKVRIPGFYAISLEEERFCVLPKFYPGDELCLDIYEDDPHDPALEGWTKNKKDDYMLFAPAEGDNEFLLGISKHNYGQVFLWQFHEAETANPILIAQSIEEFIDGIYEQ